MSGSTQSSGPTLEAVGAPESARADAGPALFPSLTDRRVVLRGAVVVAGAGVLAACSSSSPSDPGPGSSGAGGGGGGGATPTSEVPVGGGRIFPDQKVVVTQPEAGTFKAFDTTCTHQGCAVAAVANKMIICPCHGSAFDIATGDVVNGPATAPLAAKKVTVTGSTFTVS
ncbi:Rieske (2Fe-2S) protein [Intrasporangium oryzae NRRL B-24470]|uniref:Cytochrome bc1 complex Rieske iron-sulfur subunit n=1 Tax=Intrasporangium oryzae NRRL B-24470 TaxID=1386089 RepID=W9GAH8_9MICO|nr:Rieske (2Fe-2S) protein [Intrasporangium oryzae]EWT01843.1 Rieske (2Fe-2S) protein [Intrasporangium oryzae NRRL B-24470]